MAGCVRWMRWVNIGKKDKREIIITIIYIFEKRYCNSKKINEKKFNEKFYGFNANHYLYVRINC